MTGQKEEKKEKEKEEKEEKKEEKKFLHMCGRTDQSKVVQEDLADRLEICQNIYTTKFSCVRILHIENA